ncbi:electron transfer flavoprotein subunit beta/FixA family protein [Paenibacillus sp. GCM10027626]|uniref:electron transfer flavoprotein subunit beta/FixA family protein n=1 Tax=Paenibacillus sp. GCM10027626 TaxID=3273411 RepID=UPI003630B932
MKIAVLLKQTFDTEEKVLLQNGEIVEDGVKFVINPYDEYAVEEAIRIKEQLGAHIIVISAGPPRAAEALRTALAMGGDEAVLIDGEQLPGDEHVVAQALAAYLAGQQADLILGGNFSVDNGAGQIAVRVAELLQLPHVSAITKLELTGASSAIAERDAEGDLERIEVQLPAVFTAQQGLNEPRYPSLPGIMKAKKKPLHVITPDNLQLSAEQLQAKTCRVGLAMPPARAAGRLLQGQLSAQVAELAELLRAQQN